MEIAQEISKKDIENIIVGNEKDGYFDYQAEGYDVKVLGIIGNVMTWVGPNDEIMAAEFEYSAGAALIDGCEVISI